MRYLSRDVRCPKCSAPPGQSCWLVRERVVYRWRKPLRGPHRERTEAARLSSTDPKEWNA